VTALRPYVVLSCAMSADGYIDDATEQRLLLSNDADFDRVDAVRASSDAILVGAETIRRDNPRLLVRSEGRRSDRARRGLPPSPAKITVTRSGELDPVSAFFTAGEAEIPRLVYCPPETSGIAAARLTGLAGTEVVTSETGGLAAVLSDLARRGVGRLLVEGGSTILTQLLVGGLADELQLAVAPFFVGDAAAPRFVGEAKFPFNSGHRMSLADVTQIGDVAVLRYLMTSGRHGDERQAATQIGRVPPGAYGGA
jgi:5-amino-6-(5-phosphoribosylamino)uracil reductase